MNNANDTPDQQFINEARANVKRLDGEVLAAIDRRDFTTADRLDRQRTKLERAIASRCAPIAKAIGGAA